MDVNSPELDWLVSVDDHLIEPPNVWVDRLPAKYRDVGPRMDADDYWVYDAQLVWLNSDGVMISAEIDGVSGIGSSCTARMESNAQAISAAWQISDTRSPNGTPVSLPFPRRVQTTVF